MSKLSPILAPEADRAHYVAQLTLSGLAALMVGTLAWAAWQGAFPGLTKSLKGQSLVVQAQVEPKEGVSAALPPNVTAITSLPAPPPVSTPSPTSVLPPSPPSMLGHLGATTPEIPTSSLPAPLPTPPVKVEPLPPAVSSSSGDPTAPLVSPGKPITDPQAKEMVQQARESRRLGDNHGALELLRAADLHEAQHPEIMSEMALTYEAMNLPDKAEGWWRNVLGLGETGAGSYYGLARSHLDGLQDAAKTAAAATEVKPLSLGRCQVLPDKAAAKGQRVKLRIPLIAAPNTPIDPNQVDVHVYFYDKLADGTVAATHADPPTAAWVSNPVDWKTTGEELLDVIYNMPELKPEELRNLGKRTYDGYVVKLFYQDKFMGEQAEPKELLNFKPTQGLGAASMSNPLFPKN